MGSPENDRTPVDWDACDSCGGTGWFHDCMEDCCACADPDDPLGPFAFDCEECGGAGELPIYEDDNYPATAKENHE